MKILLIALSLAFSGVAHADDSSSGCGLGWQVTKRMSLLSSSIRATTNGLFFNSTFGMTFGTSGCAKHDIVRREKESLIFVANNKEQLQNQIAQGQGEYVSNFATTLGCGKSGHQKMGEILKANYKLIAPNAEVTPAEFLENSKAIIMAYPEILPLCKV